MAGVSRELHAGVVYDFTVPGDETFWAEGVLVHNCTPCSRIDGHQFTSPAEAEAAYINGGYVDCEGGLRCRGTIVVTWEPPAGRLPFAAAWDPMRHPRDTKGRFTRTGEVPSKLWPAQGYRSFSFTRADRIEAGDYIGRWQVESAEHGNRAGSTRVILKGGARVLLGPKYRVTIRRKAQRDITPASEIHGKNLHVTDEKHWSVQENLADYARVPDSHKRLLASRQAQLYFGKESVPGLDTMQKLSNVHPRGYAEGKTWSDVAGAYNWDDKKLLVGDDVAHGSVSLAAHETGHAMDSAVAIQTGLPGLVSGTPEFRRIWQDLSKYKKWVNPYYLQEGQAGPQEAFAESYAAWVITRDRPSQFRAYEIGAALGMKGPGFGSIPGVSGVPDVADRLLAYFDKIDRSISDHDRTPA